MKNVIIIPTIRPFSSWYKWSENLEKFNHNTDIFVIDEEGDHREENKKIMKNVEFFGIKEREEWLKTKGITENIIPQRSHAETSFGLLVALERKYDNIIFMDDDTLPTDDDHIGLHLNNLQNKTNVSVSTHGWVNALGNGIFPRGYPYSERKEYHMLDSFIEEKDVVLSQGLWLGAFDMNAMDILLQGNLDGIPSKDQKVESTIMARKNYAVAPSTYTTVCSMNLAIKAEIIPAFYQLFMKSNEWAIDRYDDVWSGILLKKVIDHLDKRMVFGRPFCIHDKAPRDVFKDVRAELEGVVINEKLWKVIESAKLKGDTYEACYREIANHLVENKSKFHIPGFIEQMSQKMNNWVDAVEKVASI